MHEIISPIKGGLNRAVKTTRVCISKTTPRALGPQPRRETRLKELKASTHAKVLRKDRLPLKHEAITPIKRCLNTTKIYAQDNGFSNLRRISLCDFKFDKWDTQLKGLRDLTDIRAPEEGKSSLKKDGVSRLTDTQARVLPIREHLFRRFEKLRRERRLRRLEAARGVIAPGDKLARESKVEAHSKIIWEGLTKEQVRALLPIDQLLAQRLKGLQPEKRLNCWKVSGSVKGPKGDGSALEREAKEHGDRGIKITRERLSKRQAAALIPLWLRSVKLPKEKRLWGDIRKLVNDPTTQPNGFQKARHKIIKLLKDAKSSLFSSERKLPRLTFSPWLQKNIIFDNRTIELLSKAPKLRDYDAEFWINFEPFPKGRTLEAAKNSEVPMVEEALQDPYDFKSKMHSWVEIITTPTADTPSTALLLHFDKSRYLIGNVHEGTQRTCIQRHIGLSKVNNIFLTGTVNWKTTGGLLGMILTLADIVAVQREALELNSKRKKGKGHDVEGQKLTLHGGKNLTHLLATSRRFIFRKGLPVTIDEIKEEPRQDEPKTRNWKPTYTDECIKLWAMNIRPETLSPTSRKRSLDEMSTDSCPEPEPETVAPDGTLSQEEQEHQDDQIRRGVVSHMFDSDWRLDALKKIKLRSVKLPAAIFVKNLEGKVEEYKGPLPGGDDWDSVPDIDVLVRNPWPGAMIESLPSTTPSTEAMSYIVKNHAQRGKFDSEKAKVLGVESGPQYKMLTQGESVTTKDGKIVTPKMVLEPGKEGGGFAVVDLPDKSYIDNLINREEWSSDEVMDGIGAIIWILGKGVVEDVRLRNFRSKHKTLQHIVSSPDVCPNYISLESPTEAAVRLNLLDSARFPVPVHDNSTPYKIGDSDSFEKAIPGLVLQLEPRVEVRSHKIVKAFDASKIIEDTDPEVLKLADVARTTIYDPVYQIDLDAAEKDIPSRDAEIITLGTGSALPSKYRNVSATLLRVPGYGNYLFDCGENTLGQMKRVFGAELPCVLKDLKLIWISHLHADHHLGTAAVIKAWHDETSRDPATQSKRLMIASDAGMLDWITEYSEVEHFGFSRLNLVRMGRADPLQNLFDESDTKAYGLSSIMSCPVSHCHGALAVVLTFPNDFKVAYSGDCLPSVEFARIGQGATVLIHEATFDDELAGEAIAKRHSTTSDALRIGKLMGARRILLTHFSQRYQKIPVMESEEGGIDQVAIVAFDYMRVKVGDFTKLAHFKPALLKLYEKEEKAVSK